jgi:hypothetical protein
MTEPRKPRKASWRELAPAEMAAHLLATPTISDGVWTSEPRLPRETRSDFVRRVLLGEAPESEPETPEGEAAELAGLKRGYYLLNTDGATPATPWAARRLVRSCERAVWSPWLRSRRRSVPPPTTLRSTER